MVWTGNLMRCFRLRLLGSGCSAGHRFLLLYCFQHEPGVPHFWICDDGDISDAKTTGRDALALNTYPWLKLWPELVGNDVADVKYTTQQQPFAHSQMTSISSTLYSVSNWTWTVSAEHIGYNEEPCLWVRDGCPDTEEGKTGNLWTTFV